MIRGVQDVVRRGDLVHPDKYEIAASGVFQFDDATFSVKFKSESGLLDCLDMMMSRPDKPEKPRLYLEAMGYTPPTPEWPPSNLRFDYDREHNVAAAVLLALDKNNEIHTWMTRGDTGGDDVLLTHDSWNPKGAAFPTRVVHHDRAVAGVGRAVGFRRRPAASDSEMGRRAA
jgi:hypothetical protein